MAAERLGEFVQDLDRGVGLTSLDLLVMLPAHAKILDVLLFEPRLEATSTYCFTYPF